MGDINEKHITFELEHDAEIIADNLKIKGTNDTSPIDRVNEIMRYICSLGLFEVQNNRIFCFKLLSRLDSSMTSNVILRKIIQDGKGSHDAVMIPSCKKRVDKKRLEENRKDKDMLVFGEFKNVLLSQEYYDKLIAEYGQRGFEAIVSKLSSYKEAMGKQYKSDSGAISQWVLKAVNPDKLPPPPPKCEYCGLTMIDNLCHNPKCPQYEEQ